KASTKPLIRMLQEVSDTSPNASLTTDPRPLRKRPDSTKTRNT
ncbi:25892_t:CDS:1, partial [Gigaspora rosea]